MKKLTVYALGLFVVLGKTLAQECTSSGESFESPLVDANGDLDSNALLFDMTARQRMEITSLDIRFEETLRDQDYLVSVYSKSGTYMGFESDSTAWTAAFFGRLSVPRQQSNVIALPEAAFRSVLVEGDSQHAFYIFLRSTRDTPILSSSGSAVGDVASSDDNLIIFHGQTAAPNFEASSAAAAPAIWLGRLHYNICDEDNNELDSSTSPSLSFTSTPSQSPTVEDSAVTTEAPSATVTNLPTASLRPTMKESSSPSQTPSSGLSSVLASSQLPTGEDIDTSSPTQAPSSSPSQSSTSEDSSTPSWAPSSDLSNVPTAPPVSYPPTEDDQCPSILQNPRTESMMLARTDTQVVTISENKRELLTGGQCYLSEGTRAGGCYVASYKEECVFDGYRLETSDRRSTYVIQEDRVIFCNRTRHERECCQGANCTFVEEYEGATVLMDVREAQGELTTFPNIVAGARCNVCSEGDTTLILFGRDLATPIDFCSATFGWYRTNALINPVCPFLDNDDSDDDGASTFFFSGTPFGLRALPLVASLTWFLMG